MHLLHVHFLHWFYYSIHRHKGRRAGSLVVVGCAGCCHSDTSRRVGDGGVASQRPSISVLHFCVYFDRASHFITSNCISELMIFMCVYAYMFVLYVIPQYHVFIAYINPITTFILYIITFYSMFYAFDAIMFYCTLSEMTRIKMINQSIIVIGPIYLTQVLVFDYNKMYPTLLDLTWKWFQYIILVT